jgi:hypothetical protein
MNPAQRILLLCLAGVVALGAFLVLRPEDAPQERTASPVPTTTSTSPQAATTEAEAPTTTTAEERPRRPRPAPVRIRVRDGAPVGGVGRVRARSGRIVRIAVTSDTPEELHLHGYDITRQVAPGEPATMRFRADLEGIFELELHGNGALVAQVEVRPE